MEGIVTTTSASPSRLRFVRLWLRWGYSSRLESHRFDAELAAVGVHLGAPHFVTLLQGGELIGVLRGEVALLTAVDSEVKEQVARGLLCVAGLLRAFGGVDELPLAMACAVVVAPRAIAPEEHVVRRAGFLAGRERQEVRAFHRRRIRACRRGYLFSALFGTPHNPWKASNNVLGYGFRGLSLPGTLRPSVPIAVGSMLSMHKALQRICWWGHIVETTNGAVSDTG